MVDGLATVYHSVYHAPDARNSGELWTHVGMESEPVNCWRSELVGLVEATLVGEALLPFAEIVLAQRARLVLFA